MAYVINNNNGQSGYTRVEFESALEGKQNVLQSGVSIKTVNGQSVMGSGNLEVSAQPYQHEVELTDVEKSLRSQVLGKINEIDPNGEFFKYAVISDLHTMPTRDDMLAQTDVADVVSTIVGQGITLKEKSEGYNSIAEEIVETWPSSDTSYYGRTAEPNVRLLGAIAHGARINAVFCCGDLSSGRLPYNSYAYMLEKTRLMFNKYIGVPRFFTEGNHERLYGSTSLVRGNAEWLKYLKVFNTPGMATYIDEAGNNLTAEIDGVVKKYPSNTYYVDFPAVKVRIISVPRFERVERNDDTGEFNNIQWGSNPVNQNLYDAFQFSTPSDASAWTIGIFSHYSNNGTPPKYIENAYLTGNAIGSGSSMGGQAFPAMNNGNKGLASLGIFYGHYHPHLAATTYNSDGGVREVELLNSGQFRNGNTDDLADSDNYCFSIFVYDNINFRLYEIKVGYLYNHLVSGSDSEYIAAYNPNKGWFEYSVSHNTFD